MPMLALRAGLDRLVSFRAELGRRAPAASVDADSVLAPLLASLNHLEDRVSALVRVQGDGRSLQDAREQWRASRPDVGALSKRSLRLLCGDPDTVGDPAFRDGLTRTGVLKGSRRLGERLLDAYDLGWSTRSATDLAPLIREALVHAPHLSRKAARFLGERLLLSESAPRVIAEHGLRTLEPPQALGTFYQLAVDGNLRKEARDAMRGVWQDALTGAPSEESRGELRAFGFEHFVAAHSVDPVVRAEVISFLIENTRSENEAEIAWLRARALGHASLGDPRRSTSTSNWSLVRARARTRFTQWLAREDLRFFFEEVMARTPDPHGRREYWDRWLDDTRLIDSCVALSRNDESFLRSRGLLRKDAVFSRVSSQTDDVSAFLLRFRTPTREIVAIEFSQAGNAAYFHDGEEFDQVVGSIHKFQFNLSRDLKNRESEVPPPRGLGEHWDWHNTGWQSRFDSGLSLLLR